MSVLVAWKLADAERSYLDEVWPEQLARIELFSDDPGAFERALPQVEAVVGFNSSIPQDLLPGMASLRLIQILGHGADGVLRSAGLIQERGIIVARANPGDITIAEFLLGNMIALSRRIVPMHVRLAHHGDWSEEIKARRGEGSLGGELYGSTLGLIGFGGIARELAVRADAMGMKVGLLSRQPERHKESGLEFVVDWREIDSFLGRCDYVVLALPLTEDTRGLIDAGRLQAMRRGAYLLNISRGALVDEDALCDALVDGHLAGAALDVFESEDRSGPRRYPLPRPVHDLNVILTPHYASGTVEARWRALRTVGENLRRMLSGEPLANVVDVAKGY